MKIDFIYIFNFEPPHFSGALKRLKCSLKSITSQDVNVCLSNNSSVCIYDEIKDIVPGLRYIHKPYSGPFSRALTINFGVRELVKTEYFCISDIDLIYQPDHIECMKRKIQLLNPRLPLRWIFFNYNLDPIRKNPVFKWPLVRKIAKMYCPKHSSNHEELMKFSNFEGGFAHGNGLIHFDTFSRIRGYDEELIGYGPEDDLFNTRIGKVNLLIYDSSFETSTVHLWHPRFHMVQFDKNKEFWRQQKRIYSNLREVSFEKVMANKGKSDWGRMS